MLWFFERIFLTTTSMAKFISRLEALPCISASSWGPCKESLSPLYKAFLWLLFTYASLKWLPFLSVTNITKCNAFTERLVAPSPVAFRPLLFYFSPTHFFLPLRVTLTHFALASFEALRLPTFPISGLARLGVKGFADLTRELLRPLTLSCFYFS